MYPPQAASLPPLLGIERDLFRCSQLVEEVELEPAVVGCSVVVPLSPATPLQSRQVRRGKTGLLAVRVSDSSADWVAVQRNTNVHLKSCFPMFFVIIAFSIIRF